MGFFFAFHCYSQESISLAMLCMYQGKWIAQNTAQVFCYLKHHSLNKLQTQSQEMVEASASLFVFCGRVNQLIKIAGLKKLKVQHKFTIYSPESFKAFNISHVVILCRSKRNWGVSRRGGSADKEAAWIETQTKY